jgi:hypothetical protein
MRTLEEIKAYQKQWKEKNKNRVASYSKAYHAAWYEKNKEKKLKQNKEWSKKNPEKRKEIQTRHRNLYPEKEVIRYKKYRERYPERIKDSAQRHRKTEKGYYSTYRSGAVRRGYSFELSHDEFVKILLGACVYCGADKAMGIDRVDNNEGYILGNSAPCCAHCNRMKWAHDRDFFLNHATKIAKHNNMV